MINLVLGMLQLGLSTPHQVFLNLTQEKTEQQNYLNF